MTGDIQNGSGGANGPAPAAVQGPGSLLTRREAAKWLGLSLRSLRRHERGGRIAFQRDGRGLRRISLPALQEAPVLQPGKALATRGIHPDRYRSYLYRAQKRTGLKPAHGDRGHRYISVALADEIAERIKKAEGSKNILKAWKFTDAKTQLDRHRDPFIAQKTLTERNLDSMLLRLPKDDPDTHLKRAVERARKMLDEKAVEKNFEWFEAMLYLLASGKIVFTPEEQKEYSDKCIHLLRKLMGLPLGNQ
jgi:hypothetical protein